MNSSRELLDAVCAALKASGGTGSDYSAGKALGLSKQQISSIRTGHSGMGDEAGLKAAELAGIEPVRVLVMLNAERSKSEAVKSAWGSLLNRLGGMAAGFVFVAACAMAVLHSPEAAAAIGGLCIMSTAVAIYSATRRPVPGPWRGFQHT